jgi:PAS domain S-box-containing protein
VSAVLPFFYPTQSWESVPFHSAMEAIGSLAAISMAAFLLMLRERRKEGEAYLWLACGLLAMGILDAFHAAVLPGPGTGFVWLRSTATLAGGALFACVWLPASVAATPWARSLPKLAPVAAAVFAVVSVVYPELRPPMLVGPRFTPAANGINLAGGLLFLAAMVYFMLHYRSSRDPDDVLFANLCLLFGASGLLFSLSQSWRADWWFWHLLRVLAYFIAFAYVFVVFRRAQTNLAFARSQLEADVVKLADTNRMLEAEVAERDRAEAEVRKLNQELDQRVTERTAQLQTTLEALRVEVAERKVMAEKVRAASLYARSLIETSLDPLVTISPQGKITDVNEASIKATGIPRGELTGTDFSDYFTEPEKAREGYRQVFAKGFVTDYPLTIRRRDGKLTDVLYNASVYKDEAGEVQGVFAAARDVTERKRMEDELSKSETRYRTLFNAIDEGFCVIEVIFDENEKPIDYRFLTVNPSFEKQSGLVGAQGKRMRELAPKHEEHWFEIYGKIAVTGQSVRFVNCAEQLRRWFDVHALRFGQPEDRQVAILFNDITKQREANDALEASAHDLARSNAELEQFAYVASHDLQEPLRMVVGFVQLLEKRLADKLDADTREFMGFAVDGAFRMQNLIQDILAYSRVGTRAQPLAPVDSTTALKEALHQLASRIAETGAEVNAQSLPIVMADRTQLVQLFQNLIGNAIKFCKDHAPRVRVEAAQEAGRWRFSIADNGIGIAPEYREQLFVVFKRLHSRREYPGTGIGLAICKRIVERHGGEIGVEPAPGGGSVFWFTLPEEKST